MPYAIVAAGITAAAGVYGAKQSKKGQQGASANNDALAQKQFDEEKRRYDLNREDQERWGMMQINGEEEMDRRNRADTEKYDGLNRADTEKYDGMNRGDKERSYQRGALLNQGNVDRGNKAGNQLAYRMGLGDEGFGVKGGLNDPYKDFNFNFEADPGYQFQREEGLRDIGNQFAASGNSLSGAALKAMQRFGTGLADQSYGNSYNRARSGYESDRGDFNAGNMNEYNRLASMQASGQNAINSTNGLGSTVQGGAFTGSAFTGSAGNGWAGIANGLSNASAQFGKSSDNYYNNKMGNNNANANAQSAYHNAYGNALGGGLGVVMGAWNSRQKDLKSNPGGGGIGQDFLGKWIENNGY